jgi:uncharacterized Zn ribbon protein
MSDHYSHKFGYLCFECMSELQSKAGQTTIDDFMKSPKASGNHLAEGATLDDIEAEFERR